MALHSTIEFVDLPLKARIGIFATEDPDPYEHRLDLTLAVDPRLVLITEDGMSHVFDYDAYSAQTGHPFHGKLIGYSAANWTVNPVQTGHLGA